MFAMEFALVFDGETGHVIDAGLVTLSPEVMTTGHGDYVVLHGPTGKPTTVHHMTNETAFVPVQFSLN